MSESEIVQVQEKKGRGRPPLTDEQRIERDRNRYTRQHAYYVANKDKINTQQKESKNLKYATNPEFRQKAIDYITLYNRRRTAICRFIDDWKDTEFHKQLNRYLAENL